MNTRILFRTGWILCLFLAACNPAPGASATPQAAATSTVPPVTPTPSPTLVPVAYVGGSVPCYSGPERFEVVTTVEITDEIRILGKDKTGEYWIVTKEETGLQCWLETRFVTAEGELASVPFLAPTATPIPPIPAPPQNIAWEVYCGRWWEERTVTFTWDDTDYESGYRIYEEGNLVAEVPGDVTSHNLTIYSTRKNTASVIYGIEAFNAMGISDRVQIVVTYYCAN
ncbi:MAG: hypothetical protein ACOYZ8_00350 [Chloroflexota bacterium]